MVEADRPGEQRVSVLVEPRTIREERRPIPRPGPGEVLVRVRAVGVCGSDAHYFEHGRIGDFVVEGPLVLGHEVSGDIVEVGAGVSETRIGELVSLEPQRTDPWSEQSRTGRYNLDPEVEFFATPPYDGAFCEYVTIPSPLAFRVPTGMTAEEAALIEPLAVAVATLRHARVGLGDRVAVAGAGPIGLLIAQLARLAGAVEVAVSDPLPEARERALGYGATATFDPRETAFPQQSYEVFIDASGVPAAVRAGLESLKPAGRALLVGMGADTLEIPLSIVQVRELEVRGVFRYANAWPTALVLAGQVDLAGLVTSRFGLEDVAEALASVGARDQVKVVVVPERNGGAS
ncbi:NAD(P)-dependent alcohol dehydrogenase [Leucobacter celer]|uniref:NAD(P)-dependent alcohol dehydrogenase n=1 Tax=Leucobacter celer TaxID=668625 RepID=UPI0006A79FA2|nr:NAD(P)-dependent alcohol dehydrogenase [Leucobacter celer]